MSKEKRIEKKIPYLNRWYGSLIARGTDSKGGLFSQKMALDIFSEESSQNKKSKKEVHKGSLLLRGVEATVVSDCSSLELERCEFLSAIRVFSSIDRRRIIDFHLEIKTQEIKVIQNANLAKKINLEKISFSFTVLLQAVYEIYNRIDLSKKDCFSLERKKLKEFLNMNFTKEDSFFKDVDKDYFLSMKAAFLQAYEHQLQQWAYSGDVSNSSFLHQRFLEKIEKGPSVELFEVRYTPKNRGDHSRTHSMDIYRTPIVPPSPAKDIFDLQDYKEKLTDLKENINLFCSEKLSDEEMKNKIDQFQNFMREKFGLFVDEVLKMMKGIAFHSSRNEKEIHQILFICTEVKTILRNTFLIPLDVFLYYKNSKRSIKLEPFKDSMGLSKIKETFKDKLDLWALCVVENETMHSIPLDSRIKNCREQLFAIKNLFNVPLENAGKKNLIIERTSREIPKPGEKCESPKQTLSDFSSLMFKGNSSAPSSPPASPRRSKKEERDEFHKQAREELKKRDAPYKNLQF